MKMSPSNYIELTQTFEYSNNTHNYKIRWTSLGDTKSPPVIFIHGTPWSSKVWNVYAKPLAKYFHVYLFDNPGFGTSPLGQPLPGKEDEITKEVALDADLSGQSEVFSALYQYWSTSWGSRKAHVIAHDHGGLMSLRAHIIHGCEFASLCLINVVALGPFGQPLFKLIAENDEVFNALTGPVFEGVVESYIRDAACSDLSRETMDMLKAMPVRIIWGNEDKWIPVDTAFRLGEKLNAQDVVLIDGAGHLVMYDQEGQLGVELGWWLNQVNC
ncbi:Alpha/Beta hydrolase protein [Penicillium frequentans]|nr:Alpha/Beta hydrolase protein [Penicillium glabrum]